MPEGDSIYRAARTLHRALAGHEVVRFESVLPALTRVHEDAPLTGRTIESVTAAGKHILMRFSGNLVLRTHMRMNGSWHIYPTASRLDPSGRQRQWQRPRRDMRVVVATRDFEAVGFNVPVAEFLDERAFQTPTRPPPDGSGPARRLVRSRRSNPPLSSPQRLADRRRPHQSTRRRRGRECLQVGAALPLRHQSVSSCRRRQRRRSPLPPRNRPEVPARQRRRPERDDSDLHRLSTDDAANGSLGAPVRVRSRPAPVP